MSYIVSLLDQPNLTNAGAITGNIVDPTRWVDYQTLWGSLDNTDLDNGDQKQVIIFLPFATTQRISSLIIDDPDNTTVEVSVDAQQTIYHFYQDDPYTGITPLWSSIASLTAFTSFPYTITTLRITNTGTGKINFRMVL